VSTPRIPPAGDPFYAVGREVRECWSCYGSGSVVEDAEYSAETGELVQVIGECPICGGVGTISVFLYAAPGEASEAGRS
jgi:DnaJ-class molecular chaperone